MSRNAFARCPCGHLWLHHDIEEYDDDGSDLCCVEGCDQKACPGRQQVSRLSGVIPMTDTYIGVIG